MTLVSLELALERADILLILVDHKPFKALSRNQLEGFVVIDTKGILGA
jgi:UDP-N-acetyl-D-mannosaminuronic acid dehydrogenase